MGAKTEISWTDSTWSPLRARVRDDAAQIAEVKGYTSLVQIATRMAGHTGPHCEAVSHGCDNCYSGTNNHRCLPANGTGLPFDRRARDLILPFVDEKALALPLQWRPIRLHEPRCGKTVLGKQAACTCADKYQFRPRRIFVENQSDLFGDWVPDEHIDRVFAVMALCPQHTFQVLTKRSERMLAYFNLDHPTHERSDRIDEAAGEFACHANLDGRWPLPNVLLGVSIENQATADARIPLLLQTPAAKRFISYEPALGPVDLSEYLHRDMCQCCGLRSPLKNLNGECRYCGNGTFRELSTLDWAIVGGESGPGARPMHPVWARSIRDQCAAAGVAFFLKQWGEFQNGSINFGGPRDYIVWNDGRFCLEDEMGAFLKANPDIQIGGTAMGRVGKKKSGAMLDGHEWQQFPV